MVTLSTLSLIALSQIVLAAGQVFMKKSSGSVLEKQERKLFKIIWLAVGILCLTAWFFLWLHLMTFLELNRLFAFEGVSPLLVAGASSIFLREKISIKAWLATILIGAGILMVTLF
jgi:undecaprenyl phosphate-alpha-L-ara4N flippase subunit ArnE